MLSFGNIESLQGANDENATRYHVQESPGEKIPPESDDLQALRRKDILAEFPKSASRSSRQKNPVARQQKKGWDMEFKVIPWQVFLEALKKQQPRTLDIWLRRWLFANEGVIVAMARK